jgi:hypothetical protein
MPIVSGKTPNGLVLHAQKALKEKWWYVWGTFGNVLTQSLLNSKATQYPAYNGGAYKAVHQRHIGETVSDCVGLIKGYCMWNDATDKPVYRSDLDYNTGMMYNAATKKGTIKTIPEVPGVCVYMQGHVGVYIGNGWVIECAGGKGAIKTPLFGSGATSWTHWFECPFIKYSNTSSGGQVVNKEISVGDKVTVRGGAKTYTGGSLASWVYDTTYDVLEINKDRVVIGIGRTVTAAVNKKDLIKA